MKNLRIMLVLVAALFLTVSPVMAVEEAVEATPEELFNVAREILAEKGIQAEDPERGMLVSRWIEDTVIRKNPLLNGIARKRFDRRTRLSIDVIPWTVFTKIRIRAEFRYRPSDASRTAPWRELKPDSSDYQIEMVYFGRILEKLGSLRAQELPS